jgi:integrase
MEICLLRKYCVFLFFGVTHFHAAMATEGTLGISNISSLRHAKRGITDFRFHDLRHTYASHLAMRGVHIRALQELLGHKTLAMTQRYSHLAPEQLQNAVKMLDEVIGEKRELIACETLDV